MRIVLRSRGRGGGLFISSGERQKQEPAQSWSQNLGKIIRVNEDGSVPPDNPFQDKGELAKIFWSTGHPDIVNDPPKPPIFWTVQFNVDLPRPQ